MHLHNMRHTVLMSPADSKLVDGIRSLGVNVLYSDYVAELRENERYHADMQLLIIKDTAFIPKNCGEIKDKIIPFVDDVIVCAPLKEKYPENVSLNAALVGNKLFCKASVLAPEVKLFCDKNHIRIINVNQGYAKCSTLVLNEDSIITADSTIYDAAVNNGINALEIRAGHIVLDGADYGFIGGCSGRVGEKVLFFGNIHLHPDAEQIIDFINEQNLDYICLSDEMIKDIGGIVSLN